MFVFDDVSLGLIDDYRIEPLPHFGREIRIYLQAFRVLRPYISLLLHSFKRIGPVFTLYLVRIYYLTLLVVYNSMMAWPLTVK